MKFRNQALKLNQIATASGATLDGGGHGGDIGRIANETNAVTAASKVPLWLITKPIGFIWGKITSIGSFFIELIRLILNRIASAFGVQVSDNFDSKEVSSKDSLSMPPVVSLEATGENAPQRIADASKAFSSELDAAIKDIASREPNLDKLKEKTGPQYLRDTLETLSNAINLKSKDTTELKNSLVSSASKICKTHGIDGDVLDQFLRTKDEAILAPFQISSEAKNEIQTLISSHEVLSEKLIELELLSCSFKDHCVAAIGMDDHDLSQEMSKIVSDGLGKIEDNSVQDLLKNGLKTDKKAMELDSSVAAVAKNNSFSRNSGYDQTKLTSRENQLTDFTGVAMRKSRAGMQAGVLEDIPPASSENEVDTSNSSESSGQVLAFRER